MSTERQIEQCVGCGEDVVVRSRRQLLDGEALCSNCREARRTSSKNTKYESAPEAQEKTMSHNERVQAYREAAKKAKEMGFKHPGGEGYWTAVRKFCEKNGIELPAGRQAKAAGDAKPAKKAAAKKAKAETPKEKKNRLERERRARKKAEAAKAAAAASQGPEAAAE